jgi:WD40 repeat protein
LQTGQCRATLAGHAEEVTAVAVSGDGHWALSASEDRTVRWWDVHAGQCAALFPCDAEVHAVALMPWVPWVAGVGDSAGNVWFFQIKERP